MKFNLGWPPIEFVMHSSGGSTSGTGETTDNCETTDDGGAAEKDSVDNNSHEKAIAYLNSKNAWCSDSIAKYPSLTGLFEALNDYKFDELVDKWQKELQDVPNFSKVVNAANAARNGEWDPKQAPHAPRYNGDNDKLINLDNYTNWISKDQTPKVAPVKQQATGNHIRHTTPKNQQTNNNRTQSTAHTAPENKGTTPSEDNKKNGGQRNSVRGGIQQ